MGGQLWRAKVCEEDEPVFYDWISGEAAGIIAIEIHVDRADPRYGRLFEAAGMDGAGVFPRIWLSHERNGSPLGLEAFGDFYAYESDAGN